MGRLKSNNSGKLIPAPSGGSKNGYERAIYLGDPHIPFHNEKALEIVFSFIKDFKPHKVFVLGDWIDFYDLSSFDRDPDRKFSLQKELDLGRGYLEELADLTPKATRVFMQGNHEDRLRRWLWRNPDVSSLRGLDLDELLGLADLGYESYEYHQVYNYGTGLLVKHGDLVRKHSAYTAKAELENDGISGISGHTHRLGTHFKRDHSGQTVWYEAGCLCDLEPHYNVRPNWQTGYAYSYKERQGSQFHITLVPIIKNKAIVNGVLYP